MSFESELQRAKREQEMALKLAQEAERKAQAHRSRLRQAILLQRQALVAHWTKTVVALLDDLGKSTWGKDAYTLIEPDGVSSLSWFVVRIEGEAKLNYQVTLRLEEASSEDLSLSLEDWLVRPIGFVVAGAQAYACLPSRESLQEALILAYKAGPKSNGLDQRAESVLTKSPYKRGEYEATNNWVLIPTLLTLVAGIGVIGIVFLWGISIVFDPQSVKSDLLSVMATVALLTLFGFGFLTISVVALWRTSFGKRFQRLPTTEKALAIIAAAPGALMVFAVSAGLIAVVMVIVVIFNIVAAIMGEHEQLASKMSEREERISEIAEGIKRAFKS